ncbi:hypothetical protein BDW66DRAFT_136385, partial [Aspergillus desertorum]
MSFSLASLTSSTAPLGQSFGSAILLWRRVRVLVRESRSTYPGYRCVRWITSHFLDLTRNALYCLLRVMTGQLLERSRKSAKDVPDSILSLTETLHASVGHVVDTMRAIASLHLFREYFYLLSAHMKSSPGDG